MIRFPEMNKGHWRAVAGAFLIGVSTIVSVPVHAESESVRLDRLERDIETLSRSVYRGEKPAGAISAGASNQVQTEMMNRLNQLEADLRDLTGKIEQQGNDLAQLKAAFDQIKAPPPQAANSMPVDQTASTAAAVEPSSAPATQQNLGSLVSSAETGTAVIPSGDPTQEYENAITLLKQRDYKLAEKSLNDFLKVHPDHALVPNAKYWLGESYFAQSNYQQAAKTFAEGYQKYPKGPKAADNLLKLGLSLAAMGNNTDACVALSQVKKDFPTGAGPVSARAAQESKRLNCGG